MNKFEKERHEMLTPCEDFKSRNIYFPSDWQFSKTHKEILRCERCLNGHLDKFCPNYAKCPYVKENTANTIINKFKDYTEVIFYNDNFFVPNNIEAVRDVDRSRKWKKDERGFLQPRDDDVCLSDLFTTIFNSRKRALDNMYGYIGCNDWQYFITVTFKQGKTDKLSDEVVMYQWQKFRQQLQYKFPNIGIFIVKEDTPTGVHGLHFHGFICNANVDEYLRPARNNKKIYNGKPNPQYGEMLYTKFGDPIFNFKETLTNVGFTTVVKLKEVNLLKLTNYLTKYMTKGSSNFDYNENSYLHTNNLKFKKKEVALLSKKKMLNLVNNLLAVEYKKTDKFSVYRIFEKNS